jgi:Uncharacterized conserved protein (DUF2285)
MASRRRRFAVINMPIAQSKVGTMQMPPLDPDVADNAASSAALTTYDEEHLVTYLRLLDADAEGADWRDVARIVLHLNPDQASDRARRAFESHLARAKWMTEHGYRQLLRGGASAQSAQHRRALRPRPRAAATHKTAPSR